MSTEVWKRDKKPYLVFKCKKCHQYSYVKINQKTKKCLRCGRTHQVRLIIPTGEIVYGITAALELVKEKQSKFKKLSELEQGITEELENSEYFTLQNLIEDLEKQVEDVHNLLFQLSNERNSNHKEFLRLYRDIKGYEKLKKK